MLYIVKSDGDAGYNKGRVKLSDKKKDVGLPKVRRAHFKGLPIDIELDIGMTASGKDPDGKPWSVKYDTPYGEIAGGGNEGRDGDPVDIYLAGDESAPFVYIIHQCRRDGSYDEDKCVLGAKTAIEATAIFFRHGARWAFGSVEALTWDEFMRGYLAGTRTDAREPDLLVYPKDDF